ncbi:cupredoxin domain-containing protein [Candidatus Uhrbacteria bacterium]|nr:cupredoxin domain-containing protein [Candidatus Uhrbacteria bacterium]
MRFSKLSSALTMAATLAMSFAPLASHAAVTTAFGPGDLIKGSGDTVYYLATDGHRYVFPNSKTYFTWFTDFSGVKQIPDGMLSTMPLARNNVTYRPGVKMVKVTTDPKTYVVDQGGILRHVASEQLAETLYGLAWQSRIDDIPDAYFANYRVGTPIQTASDYKPADVTTLTPTIAIDKQLDNTRVTITIGSVNNGFVPPTVTVKKGTNVTWTNNDGAQHSVVGGWGQSQPLNYQGTYEHVFNTVGSFDYHCGIHTVMQGTINVVP